LDIKRVVIFGHKPAEGRNALGMKKKPHTHSYIHGGYFRGFQALGYETHWLDANSPEISEFPTTGTLFFTEDQADERIPLSKDAFYITHSSSKTKYEEVGAARLNLCNYVSDLVTGESFNYPGERVERIDEVSFVDARSKALYQPWATNLLPSEIDSSDLISFDASRSTVNYVGTIGHDNIKPRYKQFASSAVKNGVKVKLHFGVSDDQARTLIRESRLSVDIRGDWHLQRGYIPCRIWKNLSYGMHVGSNSLLLRDVFEEKVTFEADPGELFNACNAAFANTPDDVRRQTMMWIKERHTFVNRATRSIEILRQLH
jgi:hypothetical protein